MIVKHLKELYKVDTISQDKGWNRLLTAIEELEKTLDTEDKSIMIDFHGINIVNPWDFISFKQLINKNNVHMRFTNCEELVNRIKMMFLLESLDENRVENIEIEVPKEKTLEEKRVDMYSAELIKYFDISDNEIYFKASKKYDQLQNTNSILYIKSAIDKLIEAHEITRVVLDFDGIRVLNSVLEILANLIIEYASNGIDLNINIVDEEDYKNMGLFMHKATAKVYDEQGRFSVLSRIEREKPLLGGILLTYKKSRALDEFGRSGRGEVISSRIALFAGIGPAGNNDKLIRTILEGKDEEEDKKDKKDKKIDSGVASRQVAKFITFNNNYFCTKVQWMVEHDNEMLEKLKFDIVEVSMEELGFGDYFLGSRYHFIEPIQKNGNEDVVIITGINENGSNERVKCNIPERMKIVFEDWGIKYNKNELEKAIRLTNEHLGR